MYESMATRATAGNLPNQSMDDLLETISSSPTEPQQPIKSPSGTFSVNDEDVLRSAFHSHMLQALGPESLLDPNWLLCNHQAGTFSEVLLNRTNVSTGGQAPPHPNTSKAGSFLFPNLLQSSIQPGTNSGVVPIQTNVSTAQAPPHPNTTKAESVLYPNWPQSSVQPGTSSGVVPIQTNGSTAQVSPHPNTSKASPLKTVNRERKRLTDQAYRKRRKQEKADMERSLGTLTEENESLKKENESLKECDALMRQTLRAKVEEINQLRNDLFQAKGECENQAVLVQKLSGLFMDDLTLLITFGGKWEGDVYTGGVTMIEVVPNNLSVNDLLMIVHGHVGADLNRFSYDLRSKLLINEKMGIINLNNDRNMRLFMSRGEGNVYVILKELQPQTDVNVAIEQPQPGVNVTIEQPQPGVNLTFE